MTLKTIRKFSVHSNRPPMHSRIPCLFLIGAISLGFWLSGLAKAQQAEVVSISDANLAAAIRQEIGNLITTDTMLNLTQLRVEGSDIKDLTGLEHASNLRELDLSTNRISDISPLSSLTQLTTLNLRSNDVSDVSPLSDLTQLTTLNLFLNDVSDVSPLLGLTQLIRLGLYGNPLSYLSINTHIPALQAKGVLITLNSTAHPALVKISGDMQEGKVGRELPFLFVVEAQDEHGKPIRGVSVTFTITAGGGRLSATTATTDTNGRAQTALTLGKTPGKHTVTATATAMSPSVLTFVATAGD